MSDLELHIEVSIDVPMELSIEVPVALPLAFPVELLIKWLLNCLSHWVLNRLLICLWGCLLNYGLSCLFAPIEFGRSSFGIAYCIASCYGVEDLRVALICSMTHMPLEQLFGCHVELPIEVPIELPMCVQVSLGECK